MSRRPKDIGTAFTTDVIRFLQPNGFGGAELRNQAGSKDKGDITGLGPALVVECKGGHAAEVASDLQIVKWLEETEAERRNAGADVGVLVTKRKAIGKANAGQWWCHMTLGTLHRIVTGNVLDDDTPVRMHLEDAVRQLRLGGYGDPL